ncbi:conjugal transfer protein TraX [Eggerthellaceae bacterium zg-893]|nr:conjugal transfer protein TraX [Eggerthellaceae bacterium zg-893]
MRRSARRTRSCASASCGRETRPLKPPSISAFTLKVVAIVAMTCNHAAYLFDGVMPAPLLFVFYAVGGLTFPIMAFLLVEGYRHTSSLRRYAGRLLVFALVSQVPYWLFLAHTGNVLFTLLISLFALYLYDAMQSRPLFWLAFAGLVLLSAVCDWGVFGPIMVLMMRTVPDERLRIVYPIVLVMLASGIPQLLEFLATRDLMTLSFALYALLGSAADMPLLMAYDGRRGRPMKWFFYAYYPAHIAVLGLVAMGMGANLPLPPW